MKSFFSKIWKWFNTPLGEHGIYSNVIYTDEPDIDTFPRTEVHYGTDGKVRLHPHGPDLQVYADRKTRSMYVITPTTGVKLVMIYG